LAIVLSIGVAFWAIYWDHRQKRLQYEERRLMIERGMMPPRRAFGAARSWCSPASGSPSRTSCCRAPHAPALRRGSLGVSAALVGLTGLGYLVYARIARNRDA
jgi:hypothetical protein